MKWIERWTRATESLFARITRPPRARGKALAVVAGLVGVIAAADHVTGPHVSLFIFYLVPVCLAVAWLGWGSAVATTLATMVFRVYDHFADAGFHALPLYTYWNLASSLGMFLVVAGALHNLLILHRELESRVTERTRALQETALAKHRLQRELLEISARERNLIGRELHDELGQHLVGTALAAQVLMQRLEGRDGEAARDASAIVRWVEAGIAKTRQIARGLLLSSIEPEELGRELSELAAASSRGGVTCRFRLEGAPAPGDGSSAAQLLRIAQEATRNALRHAQARHVDITLAGDAGATCLMVEDDGRGLPPAGERGGGMGLRIMEHRAALAGATLTVTAAPGEGTRVICRLPAES